MKFKLNNKGQFSIIAALLVTVVLVASVMTTYSAIRYSPVENQPQILSAIDETNVALKQVLGFTVGYYGSVLQVTGNQTYAQQLATNYLSSGLTNVAEIRPEWGATFNITSLKLNTCWYTNESYSQGTIIVNYNLNGLDISGVSYSTSCRLDVSIQKANSTSQAQLQILQDDGTPLINLGSANLKFYRYAFGNLTWGYTVPTNITSYADGTYVIDLPPGVTSDSYAIQVQDTRGLMVVASAFSQFTSTLAWNSTGYQPSVDYVDNNNLLVGSESNFTAQQSVSDSVFDSLTEQPYGLGAFNYYPTACNLLGSTTISQSSGNITVDTDANDGNYLQLHSYPTAFSASTDVFGYSTVGGTNTALNNIKGSRFTTTTGGMANSINAYLSYTPPNINVGNAVAGSSGDTIEGTIRGERITTPSSPVTIQSISAYIHCSSSSKSMKAAIYDNSGNQVATSAEISVPVTTNWQTFTFASPPTLAASTNYVLVVWSTSGSGSATLYYTSTTGANGRYFTSTYGTWPSSIAFTTNTYNYCIYCSYQSSANTAARCAVYSSDGSTKLGATDEVTITASSGSWVTFPFTTKPILSATTPYVLVVWSADSSNVNVYYNANTAERFEANGATYPTWPASVSDQSSLQRYSIYCNYSVASQYTVQAEFTGSSDALTWQQLIWAVDSAVTAGTANCTLQLYDYANTKYPTSGYGYLNTLTLGTTDTVQTQTILSNPANFRNGGTNWKLLATVVSNTATPFDFKVDLANFTSQFTNYALNLQEQWVNVNATNIYQDLCVKTGALGSESLLVQVLHAGAWQTLMTLLPNFCNNASLVPYIDSSTLTIRFVGSNDITDPTPDNWKIDSVYIKNQPDISFLVNQQDSTFTLELLQNGTMRWLGQNLQLTSQTLPIPPIPVKAIHVNETISGVAQEVPFQIEDWASNYQIPLGLTSNETVFSNRQMVVFLLNSKVSDFTVWWNGSDTAVQTSLAFTNKYFCDSANTLNNSYITLGVSTDNAFTVTTQVVGKSTSSTANFMRINNQNSTYGAGSATVICNGTVRDIIQQESEWSGGAPNCPNLYANIILTLPANASYYTYQLRIMFINSSQSRAISDLTPLILSTALNPVQVQTENSTLAGFPLIQNGTGTFSNSGGVNATAHHWTQLITNSGRGVGLMFTDTYNQKLYAFDSIAGATSGDLNVNSANRIVELSPVDLAQASFKYAYDITWQGAVVAFDGNTPICSLYDGTTPTGLWILAEYPPTLTVTAKS